MSSAHPYFPTRGRGGYSPRGRGSSGHHLSHPHMNYGPAHPLNYDDPRMSIPLPPPFHGMMGPHEFEVGPIPPFPHDIPPFPPMPTSRMPNAATNEDAEVEGIRGRLGYLDLADGEQEQLVRQPVRAQAGTGPNPRETTDAAGARGRGTSPMRGRGGLPGGFRGGLRGGPARGHPGFEGMQRGGVGRGRGFGPQRHSHGCPFHGTGDPREGLFPGMMGDMGDWEVPEHPWRARGAFDEEEGRF